MQFELFEKLSSSNKFQIELEKSYDYFLMIYMKKKKTFLALFECFLQSARLTCTVVIVWLYQQKLASRSWIACP